MGKIYMLAMALVMLTSGLAFGQAGKGGSSIPGPNEVRPNSQTTRQISPEQAKAQALSAYQRGLSMAQNAAGRLCQAGENAYCGVTVGASEGTTAGGGLSAPAGGDRQQQGNQPQQRR